MCVYIYISDMYIWIDGTACSLYLWTYGYFWYNLKDISRILDYIYIYIYTYTRIFSVSIHYKYLPIFNFLLSVEWILYRCCLGMDNYATYSYMYYTIYNMMIWYYIYYIRLHHVVYHYMILCLYMVSYHITLFWIYVILNHIIPYYIIWCNVLLHHIISYYFTFYYHFHLYSSLFVKWYYP